MSGRWIEREPMYLSFDIYNCQYCGKNVPRHVWLEDLDDAGGDEEPFCTPEVAAIFRRSRLPHDATRRRPNTGVDLTEELRLVRERCSALRRD